MNTSNTNSTAPKSASQVTILDIEQNISSEWYINAADGVTPDMLHQPPVPSSHPLRLLTFCVLVLKNGFTVTGESACVSAANYDETIGRRVARENAIDKVWPLVVFALKQKIAENQSRSLPLFPSPDSTEAS